MRYRSITVLAATVVATLGLAASSASASVPASVRAQWVKLDNTFGKADTTWSKVLEEAHPSVSALAKACATFVPAIKTFDSGLEKVGFTGKTKTDIGTLVKVNKQAIPVLSHVTSISGFEKQFGPLFASYTEVQAALGKDLNIPQAEIFV